MLKGAAASGPSFWRQSRLWAAARTVGALGGILLSSRAALAGSMGLAPILAQESSAEGGYPIIEWLIVIVFTGAALFAICRSSRRN
jgi:hypothetical protein